MGRESEDAPIKPTALILALLWSTGAYAQGPGGANPAPRVTASSVLFTVHIDEVGRESIGRFEGLNEAQARARNAVLSDNHLPAPPGYTLSTPEGKYFAFRGRASFGDLDKTPNYPDEVKEQFREKVDPYSDSIHPLLTFHHNEIWRLDTASSYVPATADFAQMSFAMIHSEWVIPGMDDRYDSVVTLFRQALEKESAKQACLVFYSSYGSGGQHFVWQARNKDELADAHHPATILIGAYGEAEGNRIMSLWKSSLLRSEDTEALARPEMNDLPAGTPWLGILRK